MNHTEALLRAYLALKLDKEKLRGNGSYYNRGFIELPVYKRKKASH